MAKIKTNLHAHIVALVNEGAKQSKIAEAFGVSSSTVNKIVKLGNASVTSVSREAPVTTAPTGPLFDLPKEVHSRAKKFSDGQVTVIRKKHRAGSKIKALMSEFNASRSSIYRVVNEQDTYSK
jgi:transposase